MLDPEFEDELSVIIPIIYSISQKHKKVWDYLLEKYWRPKEESNYSKSLLVITLKERVKSEKDLI